MLLSSRFPKWAVVAISILALLAALFFSPHPMLLPQLIMVRKYPK